MGFIITYQVFVLYKTCVTASSDIVWVKESWTAPRVNEHFFDWDWD